LFEEPIGVLGYAAILDRSEVAEFVRELKMAHPEKVRLMEFWKKSDLRKAKCYYEDWSLRDGKIAMEIGSSDLLAKGE
jgi:hypothetical protein